MSSESPESSLPDPSLSAPQADHTGQALEAGKPGETPAGNAIPTEGPVASSKRGLKIGSQRAGSAKIRVQPQPVPDRKPRVQQPSKAVPPPRVRDQLSPEMELEVMAALGGMSLDEALGSSGTSETGELEPDSRHQAKVAAVHRDNVFVDLGGRNQGVLSLSQFDVPPEIGSVLEVLIARFDPEEGLYRLALPGAAIGSADWSELAEGVLVETHVTGHNKGGLECTVGNIRGFIPASQIARFRVEDLSQFVGEKFPCVVTEANPEKRNLVLSRRAVLEREQAAAKEKMLAELAEGDIREGTVRSLRDFGAFVDLGNGIDGLVHVSQLGWNRVGHPSEVLELGQAVKVKVRSIDRQTGKIGLSLRDLTENPWAHAAQKYPATTVVEGTVTRLMDFGALVQLEPGIEGLVHISELAHHRVWRASDVLSEGDKIEAKVLSIDTEQQRISLSIKAIQARPEPVKKKEPDPEQLLEEPPKAPVKKRTTPLKGGLGRSSDGEKFGLKW